MEGKVGERRPSLTLEELLWTGPDLCPPGQVTWLPEVRVAPRADLCGEEQQGVGAGSAGRPLSVWGACLLGPGVLRGPGAT